MHDGVGHRVESGVRVVLEITIQRCVPDFVFCFLLFIETKGERIKQYMFICKRQV
jgi:hypothetical protein